MSTMRSFFILMMLMIGCQQAVGSTDEPTPTANTNVTSTEVKPDDQLQINKNALLQDPNEQIRIKAAMVMMYSDNTLDRETLFETLKLNDNSAARMAVCKA